MNFEILFLLLRRSILVIGFLALVVFAIDTVQEDFIGIWLSQYLDSDLLDKVEALSIIGGLIVSVIEFLAKSGSQLTEREKKAWDTIQLMEGNEVEGGRIQEIQFLHKKGRDLSGLKAPKAFLRGIQLQGANLSSVDFSSAKLNGANFNGADLSEANLEKADLSGVNFRNAKLIGANLSEANLEKTEFRSANLCDANLSGAKFSGTKFKNSSYNEQTQFPQGFNPQNQRMRLIGSTGDSNGVRFDFHFISNFFKGIFNGLSGLFPSNSYNIHFDIITVDSYGKEINRRRGSARQEIEILGNGINLEMIYIPGGTFMMGSSEAEGRDNEKPQHQVNVPSFWMGKFQVTQAQWKAVAALPKVNRDLKPEPSHFKGNNLPVERVSWYDAVEFCSRLSKFTGKEYRLPSEAEWEYACRAGTKTPFYFGETITGELANYYVTRSFAKEPKGGYRQTTPVGEFPPNAFGLYDMHGNLLEWCFDDYYSTYEGAPKNGSAWVERTSNNDNRYRVLRGGSWNYAPGNCRSAYRLVTYPDFDSYAFGLRVVCGVAPRT